MRSAGQIDSAASPPAAGERRSSPQRHFGRGRLRLRARLLAPAAASAVFAVALPAADDEEMALVRRIRARIAAGAADEPAAADAYEQTIPGSAVSFRMEPVPAGEFSMGSPPDEEGRNDDGGPQRRVRVDAFWMGSREVTWDEYRLFMLRESSGYRDPDADAAAVSSPTPPYVDMSFGMGIEGFPAISMTQHAAAKYAHS